MSKKSALGKGLSALLPSDEERDDPSRQEKSGDVSSSQLYRFDDGTRLLGRVAEIDLDRIRPNPYQPRQEFNEDALNELSASIQQLGIIQPLTVRSLGDGQFEIISGERRFRAARRAGLQRVPAFVRKADSEEMLEMALVENLQREELNPIEIALGYQRLVEEVGLTQEEIAEKVSKSRATVANFLRLLRLPPRIQAALRDRDVAMGHARALINVDDENAQIELLKETVREDLSVREVERRVRDLRDDAKETSDTTDTETAPPEPAPPSRDDLQLETYRKRLRAQFSTQVQIRRTSDEEGKIELSFYSAEDLERLMEVLTGD
jgi:ParB family chromosome partitioning protein